MSHAAFPGLVIAYLLGLPLYVGGGVAAVGDRARHRRRSPVAAGSASIPRSASCSRDVRARASCCSARSRATSPTCSATCSATCSGSRSPTSSRSRSSAASSWSSSRPAQGAALRVVRSGRRGGLGAARSTRLEYLLLGLHRGDDRRQHPGGRDHHGRGDAGDPGGDGAARSCRGSGTSSGRDRRRRRRAGRRASTSAST